MEELEEDLLRLKMPYGEMRSMNVEIGTFNDESDISSSYYHTGSTRSVDQNSEHSSKENASCSSVTSEKYYTPDEDKPFPDFFVS